MRYLDSIHSHYLEIVKKPYKDYLDCDGVHKKTPVFPIPNPLMFSSSTLCTFFSPEQTRAWLGRNRENAGNVLATILGIIAEFCSRHG